MIAAVVVATVFFTLSLAVCELAGVLPHYRKKDR